jgi:hypothetical protein
MFDPSFCPGPVNNTCFKNGKRFVLNGTNPPVALLGTIYVNKKMQKHTVIKFWE